MAKKIWLDDDTFSPSDEVLSEKEAENIESMVSSSNNNQEQPKEQESYNDAKETFYERHGTVEQEEVYTEEELEDDPELIFNARMRLEQGRLYEMILNHNLFEGTSAHPKAVANVERELKAFIRTRLEVLLGLKPDPKIVQANQQVTNSQFPFNELEIALLKQVLSKMTNGATERADTELQLKQVEESKQSIKPLSISKTQNSHLNTAKIDPIKITVKKPVESASKNVSQQQKPVKVSETPKELPERLKKNPFIMSASELLERNKYISEQQKKAKAFVPENQRVPMPTADQLVSLYSQRTSSISPLIQAIVKNLSNSKNE